MEHEERIRTQARRNLKQATKILSGMEEEMDALYEKILTLFSPGDGFTRKYAGAWRGLMMRYLAISPSSAGIAMDMMDTLKPDGVVLALCVLAKENEKMACEYTRVMRLVVDAVIQDKPRNDLFRELHAVELTQIATQMSLGAFALLLTDPEIQAQERAFLKETPEVPQGV